MISDNSH